jgi:hypothetical protein
MDAALQRCARRHASAAFRSISVLSSAQQHTPSQEVITGEFLSGGGSHMRACLAIPWIFFNTLSHRAHPDNAQSPIVAAARSSTEVRIAEKHICADIRACSQACVEFELLSRSIETSFATEQ